MAQGTVFLLQMTATVVLARLLTPADFGVVTMVTTFSLLLTNFGLNGLTEALIQRQELDRTLVSNLFWICFTSGTVLAAGFASAGTLMTRFYHDPRVAHVAIGIAATIFFTSISVPNLALLKRALLFPLVSGNDIVGRLVSVVVSICLAWAGWGYWALVAGAIAAPVSVCLGAWALCRWTPDRPRRHPDTMPVIRSALNIYGFFATNYFSRNVDNLLVGSRFGSAALGVYKRAYDLFVLPANQLLFPVSSVALPTLSRLLEDQERYQRYLLRAVSILAFVGMGLGACFTVVGQDLVFVLLGPKWLESGRIFRLFGPGIGAMFVSGTWSWIHLSIGRADRCLRWAIFEFFVTSSLFLVALPWGPSGIALAWTTATWILAIPAFWYAGRPIGFGITPFVSAVWRYALSAILACGIALTISARFLPVTAVPDYPGALLRVVVMTTIFVAFYISVVTLLHGGLEPIHQLTRLVPEFLPWKRLTTSSSTVTELK